MSRMGEAESEAMSGCGIAHLQHLLRRAMPRVRVVPLGVVRPREEAAVVDRGDLGEAVRRCAKMCEDVRKCEKV